MTAALLDALLAVLPAAEATASAGKAAVGAVGQVTTFDIVFPLTVLLIIGLIIPTAMQLINRWITAKVHGAGHSNPGKQEPVEGGLNATLGTANERFSVKFYLVAMLFLAFDLEVAFLYPWAIHFGKSEGWSMIWLLVVFLAMLEVGYLYLYKKGALDWDK